MSVPRTVRGLVVPVSALVAVVVAAAAFVPQFATAHNMLGLGQSLAGPAMVAAALSHCIALGDVDLSVESVLALGAIAAAAAISLYGHPLIGVLAGAAAGGLVGAANAALIVRVGLPSVLATLGTLAIVRAACLWMSQGQALGNTDKGTFLPADLAWVSIPAPIWSAAVVVALLVLGGRMPCGTGRSLAAERMGRLCLLGLIAGLAGAVLVGDGRAAQPMGWQGTSIDVLAACMLGGAVVGRRATSVAGPLIGVAAVGAARNAMDLLCVPASGQFAARGVIFLVALSMSYCRRGSQLDRGAPSAEVISP